MAAISYNLKKIYDNIIPYVRANFDEIRKHDDIWEDIFANKEVMKNIVADLSNHLNQLKVDLDRQSSKLSRSRRQVQEKAPKIP